MMDKSLLLAQNEQAQMLPAFDEVLLFSLERRYLEIADMERLELATNTQEYEWDWKSHLRMLKIEEVSYEDESRLGLHLLNMQNVLASMKDDSHNVISVIHSTNEKTSLYYGLSKRVDSKSKISTDEYAKILKQSLHGNFLGVRVHSMKAKEIEDEVLDPIEFCENVTAFPGIPSLRLKDAQAPYVQGIDRFIEGMRGEKYCLITIAEPIPLPVVDGIIKNLFDLSSSIHSQVKATVQKMKGSSDTVNVGMFGMMGNSSTSLTEPGAWAGIPFGTVAVLAFAKLFATSLITSITNTMGLGGQGGYAHGWNRSQAVTQEVLNKTAEYCEKHCDAYIERLQAGKNLGLWNVGVYLLTNNNYTQLRAKGLLRAAFSGDTTYWEPMRSLQLNHEAIARYIMNFNNPKYNLFLYGKEGEGEKHAELGHPFGEIMGGVSTPLNTEELSIIMNVPRQEVQGITIREAAPFGVNYVPARDGNNVRLGRVVHKRMPMDDIPYVIPQSLFQKHAFVCGVTGSGKTNTCMTLLKNLNLPFLVIEPAKTEYRQMLNFMPDLKIFTLGSETESPFRINPFEFNRKGKLLTHIDSIKAVFNAAFPMYASMPYILEEAIIEIYRDKGWDLATTTNRYLDNLESDEFYDYIPTLQDLYDKIEPIVRRKSYAQEQTMNIQAALMARLSSLLTGSKGLMFNTRRSTPLSELLNHPVVLELKNIGDDDEKCFIMGLILSSIYQYRENSGSVGSDLKHVLLIEEAHRLLRRTPEFVSPEIGNSRGKAVETFTNVISEIREYGQGVIIVDQIPSKLTPDVVKNTNIKIVHRTLAKDDRDYVGSTMNLTEAQERELCLLEVGRAVIHREGMDKAFLVQMDRQKGELKFITDEEVKAHMANFTKSTKAASRQYGLDKREGLAEAFEKEDFRRQSENLLRCAAAALLLMIFGDMSRLDEIRKAFAEISRKDLGIDGDVRFDAHFVYNAELLFAGLYETYKGNYRDCLRAKRLFIDAWFGDDIDVEDLRSAVASFTNITGDDDICSSVVNWHIRTFSHPDAPAIEEMVKSGSVDFSKIDKLLGNISYSMMCGVALLPEQKRGYRKVLLKTILTIARYANVRLTVAEYGKFLDRKGE